MNIDEYDIIETRWFSCYFKNDEVIYFDSFGIRHIPRGIKNFIGK